MIYRVKTRFFEKVEYVDGSLFIVRNGFPVHRLKFISLNIVTQSLVGLLDFFSNFSYLLNASFYLLGIEIDLLLFLDIIAEIFELIYFLVKVKLFIGNDEIKLDL